MIDRPRKRKRQADSRAPKSYESAYVIFTKTMLPKLKEEEGIEQHQDALKRIGSLWAALSQEQKEVITKSSLVLDSF